MHQGSGWLQLVENVMIGPFIAVASFVCSDGNVPLASLLWANGISFGGVVAFIYGDLLIIPLLLLYRKYFGWKAAAIISAWLYASMVLAGLGVDLLFGAWGWIPQGPRPMSAMSQAAFVWNSTTWLTGPRSVGLMSPRGTQPKTSIVSRRLILALSLLQV